MTDGDGGYTLSGVATGDFGTFVSISKPGYEDMHAWVDGRNDVRHDFRLYRPVTINAGESARTVCLIPESAHGTNAASAVMAGMRAPAGVPSTGTVILETAADNPADPLWLLIGSDVGNYPVQMVTRLETSATAGAIVTVMIFRPWSPTPNDTGTLRTALLPN
jgi:hypothetical protein